MFFLFLFSFIIQLEYNEVIKEVCVEAKVNDTPSIPGLNAPSIGRNTEQATLKRESLPWNGEIVQRKGVALL
jgi:hypothetical protein